MKNFQGFLFSTFEIFPLLPSSRYIFVFYVILFLKSPSKKWRCIKLPETVEIYSKSQEIKQDGMEVAIKHRSEDVKNY